MPLLDHFGIVAPFYDRANPLTHIEKLIEIVDLPAEGLLLDAGGGTGRVAQRLKNLVHGVYIVDLSIKMLLQASRKGGLQTIGAHTESLPFPDHTFNRVIMIDAFHHVCDQKFSALEMWRVLKPNGKIVIEEPDISKPAVKLIAVAEKIMMMRSRFLSPTRIAELFSSLDAQISIELDGHNSWVVVEKNDRDRVSSK